MPDSVCRRHSYMVENAGVKSVETLLYLMRKAGIVTTDCTLTMSATDDEWLEFLKLIDQYYGINRTDEDRRIYLRPKEDDI